MIIGKWSESRCGGLALKHHKRLTLQLHRNITSGLAYATFPFCHCCGIPRLCKTKISTRSSRDTEVLGTQVLGTQVLGTQVLGTQVLGTQVLGTQYQLAPAPPSTHLTRSASPDISHWSAGRCNRPRRPFPASVPAKPWPCSSWQTWWSARLPPVRASARPLRDRPWP